ncbi:MAG: prepilin-type N-terminal cleavage/methylation domain-containing protein [Armatimonadota bacterium]|nr:prepilin-type N-terminal cleavage/methylation domain-containing protein [Armatimonadota bacterium]MDR7451939.1 prepilin-type N-terminal cleavage/methylation domain-containing protein [Armatimonadota bacterium]MDR7466621.1 prepilin-type N-terminal cleavage/methylation domain-containing protein [Armatimonadota bacterium]MDR7492905.1 prepilin-type N-terminal cleavage/methylation domain-containing protein [Armatimonadota bacterium]MDR7500432.1 prepilin-type N-terminal cleavage/methylation domain
MDGMAGRRAEAGLTLVEMVVSLALMSLVVLTFYGLIAVAVRGWGALEGQMEVQQQPRVALTRIANEVRQARFAVVGNSGSDLGLAKVTVLTQDAAAGATAIAVEDPSPLSAGMPLVIVSVDRLERGTVAAIAGSTVTLSTPLARTHRRGEAVYRAATALSADASAGAASFAVDDATVVRSGDLIAVGDEGPLVVSAVVGNLVTVAAPLAQSHLAGEAVQPLTVMFRCEGGCADPGVQVTRCTAGCSATANRAPLADGLAAPVGRTMFAATTSALAVAASAGSTQICPATVTGFAVGDRIQIGSDAQQSSEVLRPERRTVASITGGCLVLDRGLTRGYPAGTAVRVPAVELAVRATLVNDAAGGQVQEVVVATRAGLRN